MASGLAVLREKAIYVLVEPVARDIIECINAGTLAHELGHMLGLGDLYKLNRSR